MLGFALITVFAMFQNIHPAQTKHKNLHSLFSLSLSLSHSLSISLFLHFFSLYLYIHAFIFLSIYLLSICNYLSIYLRIYEVKRSRKVSA